MTFAQRFSEKNGEFDGIVMTDWWAVANWEEENAGQKEQGSMVQVRMIYLWYALILKMKMPSTI